MKCCFKLPMEQCVQHSLTSASHALQSCDLVKKALRHKDRFHGIKQKVKQQENGSYCKIDAIFKFTSLNDLHADAGREDGSSV